MEKIKYDASTTSTVRCPECDDDICIGTAGPAGIIKKPVKRQEENTAHVIPGRKTKPCSVNRIDKPESRLSVLTFQHPEIARKWCQLG